MFYVLQRADRLRKPSSTPKRLMNSSVSSGSSRSSTLPITNLPLTFGVFSAALFRKVTSIVNSSPAFVAFNAAQARNHIDPRPSPERNRSLLPPSEPFAVYRAGEVDGHAAVFRIKQRCLFFLCRLLLTGVQHHITVSAGDPNNRFFNFDDSEAGQLNFRIDFKPTEQVKSSPTCIARNIVRARLPVNFLDDRVSTKLRLIRRSSTSRRTEAP